MTKTLKLFSTVSLSFLILFLAIPAFAASNPVINSASTGLDASGEAAGYGTTALPLGLVIGQGIAIIIGLLGVLFLLYLFYGGLLWMTSNGDSTKVDKAKHIIVNSVIGVAIVLTAFSVTKFVIDQLGAVSSGTAVEYNTGG